MPVAAPTASSTPSTPSAPSTRSARATVAVLGDPAGSVVVGIVHPEERA